MKPIEAAYDTIMSHLAFMVPSNYSAVSGSLYNIISGIFVILIAWEGYKLFYGHNISTSSIIIIIKYSIISIFLTSYSSYDFFIVNLFENFTESFPGLFGVPTSPDQSISIAKRLDEYLFSSIDTGWSMVSLTNLGDSLIGIIIILSSTFLSVFSMMQIGVSEIGIILLLSFGPISLVCGFFPPTRGIFEGWLKSLITLIILKIFILVAINILLNSLGSSAYEMQMSRNATDSISYIITFLAYTSLMTFVVLSIPDFASQIGGGLSLGASSLTQTVVAHVKRPVVRYAQARAQRASRNATMWMMDAAAHPESDWAKGRAEQREARRAAGVIAQIKAARRR